MNRRFGEHDYDEMLEYATTGTISVQSVHNPEATTDSRLCSRMNKNNNVHFYKLHKMLHD